MNSTSALVNEQGDRGHHDPVAARPHPPGLWTLSGIELWERFSFYGLQVLLAYYLYFSVSEGGLGFSMGEGLAIAGAYGGGVYLLQPVGAWIADRLVPAQTVVVGGGLLVIAGHIVLSAVPNLTGLLIGLVLITCGTGGLFPTVLALMGDVYRDRSTTRDAGFSIFYTGILVGALVGPLATGFLHERWGFHLAFAAAAVGMALGLLIFLLRSSTLPASATSVPNPLERREGVRALLYAVGALAVVVLVAVSGLVTLANLNYLILALLLVVAAVYIVRMQRSRDTAPAERGNVRRFAAIFGIGMVFYTLVLQLFTTFAVYADTRAEMSIGSLAIPAAYISTFQVVTAIVLGPLLASLWTRMGARQPSTVAKLALGMGAMALTFAFFAVVPIWHQGPVTLIPIVIGMMLHGISEIIFAPVAMSAVSQVSPRAFRTQTMAVWGLAIGSGASLSGLVSQWWSPENESLYFGITAAVAAVMTLVIILVRRPLAGSVLVAAAE